jgi:RNA polymerase sigma-70 factor (ECF subfamily)
MEEILNSVLSKDQLADPHPADLVQEAHWVKSSQRGDVVAFNRLVLKWEKAIYNLSFRMLQDPDEAAEATQEVFLAAFRSIRRFRHTARFSTWLYRIACNHCISRLRRRPPGVHYSLDDLSPQNPIHQSLPAQKSHELDVLNQEHNQRVRQALGYLPAEQRAVIELRFFQDLTLEEIAEVVQLPLGTIKSRLYGGLEVLKAKLARASLKASRR